MPAAAVLLAGDDGVPVRVREELAGAGVEAVAICSAPETIAGRAALAAGTRVVFGDPKELATWREAGLENARAIGILGSDDLANLKAALAVAEENGSQPLVVRMFSADLAGGVERMLGHRGRVLSEIEVAAPAFVQAALSGNTGQRVTIARRVLEVGEVDPHDPTLVLPLANADTPTEVLPSRDALGTSVLGLTDPSAWMQGARGAVPAAVAASRRADLGKGPSTSNRPGPVKRAAAWLKGMPRRAWILLATIATVATASTIVFAEAAHFRFVDAVYFTATTMATVGYGDVNLSNSSDWLKVYDIGLMAVSAVLLASVLALVTDQLVSSRIDRALGRFPRPTRDHVIVCGLGKAGSRIIAGLSELGVPCIGVERDDSAVGIAVARQLGIPVVFGDMRTPGTVEALGAEHARCLLAVTSDDLANLQCGLAAREHAAELRIVLRIFDAELAERLDHGVDFDLTRSVSALAAPAFAAALLDRPLAQSLSLSNVPLRILELELEANSSLIGSPVGELNTDGVMRVLSLDLRWRFTLEETLQVGSRISLVGTRDACDSVLRRAVDSRAAEPSNSSRQPQELLSP